MDTTHKFMWKESTKKENICYIFFFYFFNLQHDQCSFIHQHKNSSSHLFFFSLLSRRKQLSSIVLSGRKAARIKWIQNYMKWIGERSIIWQVCIIENGVIERETLTSVEVKFGSKAAYFIFMRIVFYYFHCM